MHKFHVVVLFIALLLTSCSSDNPAEAKSSENNIVSFVIPNITTKINDNSIDIAIPANSTNLTFETTIEVSAKAQANFSTNGLIDYATTSELIVTAENGTQKKYTINIIRQEGITVAKAAALGNINGVINLTEKTIVFDVSKDDLLNFNIRPTLTFEVSAGCSFTLSSASNVIIDFDAITKLTLTKSNNSVEVYDIIFKNSNAYISNIAIPYSNKLYPDIRNSSISSRDYPATFTTGLTIYDKIIRMLTTEDVSSKVPTYLNISYKSSVSPSKTIAQNFNQDVSYTVTAENGSLREVKIRVVKEKLLLSGEDTSLTGSVASASRSFGTHYIAISPIQSLQIVNIETNAVFNQTFTDEKLSYNDENYIRFQVASTVPTGKYRVKATLANGDVINTYYLITLQ
jgi:hypothetical protein